MADILNSALTGEADFAGTIFGGKNQPEASEAPAVETPAPEPVETPKEEAPKEEKKTPVKAEPKAKPKATKEETAKAVEKITESASRETKEEAPKAEASSEDDLPVNPHFQDKQVSDKPEGDDSEKGISSWKEIKTEMKKAREERDRLKAELEATKEKVGKYEGETVKSLQE
jgi:hypothetical protein